MKHSLGHLRRSLAALTGIAIGALAMISPARADDPPPALPDAKEEALTKAALETVDPSKLPLRVRSVGVDERLGKPLPLQIEFTNSKGEKVVLEKYFKNNNKPAIIGLVYYTCPVTCTAVMEKLHECVQKLDLTVGKDYQILMFSIKPSETTELAASTKELYVTGYNRGDSPEVRASWEFHTGPVESSRALAEGLGFRYNEFKPGDYTHPVVLFITTPDGKVARYLYGWNYEPKDVKLSLIEAASGRATLAQKILAYCYMWDGDVGKYTLQVMRVVQIAGVVMIVVLATVIGALLLAERARRRRLAAGGAGPIVQATGPGAPAAA